MDTEEQTQLDGVVVYRVTTPEGVQVKYQNTGNIDPLAVPALLELAAQLAKQQLGLS